MTTAAQTTTEPRWKIIGPGLVVAATGVGAADLVATLVAGSKYGYALLWCAVLGCLMKIVLVEGAGRYSLATGRTIFEGWRTLGIWTTWYFGIYVVVWGFVYGAAAMAGTGLPLHSLFPVLDGEVVGDPQRADRPRAGVVRPLRAVREDLHRPGRADVRLDGGRGRHSPCRTCPTWRPGWCPRIPDGGILYTLSLAGGVGGTITLAAYGYWLREKGWTTPQFMRVMRIDNSVAYLVTGIFVVSTLIVGAELLYSANIAVAEGEKGLLSLADVLDDRYGDWAGKVFLVGFWAAAMSSLVGVWNGVSLMFADFLANTRGQTSEHPDARMGGRYYRAYILWLTFPPMVMMFLGEPIAADPRVRRPRRVLHAVPRRHPALDPQHRPHPGRVAQQDLVERRHGPVCAGLRGAGGERDDQADPGAVADARASRSRSANRR